jgi:hypothetical protein
VVAKSLLGLVAGGVDRAQFCLGGLRAEKGLFKASWEMLSIVSIVMFVNRRMEDLIEPPGVLVGG